MRSAAGTGLSGTVLSGGARSSTASAGTAGAPRSFLAEGVESVLAGVAAGNVTWYLCRRAVGGGPTTARATTAVGDGAGPGDAQQPGRWWRTNHAGRQVTLLEGPAFVAGAAAGLTALALTRPEGRRQTAAVATALLGSALVGGYDDLFGSARAKGFRGHLSALRRGEVTSGMIKIAGVGLSSLAAAVVGRPAAAHHSSLSGPPAPSRRPGTRPGSVLDVAVNAGLTAASANLINLLDLRPGRALKGGLLLAVKCVLLGRLVGTPPAYSADRRAAWAVVPVAAAALGALPSDLAGRSMLGDCGANALGAGVAAAAAGSPRSVRILVLAVTLGLNLLSERYSFTAVIEANPLLRAIDHLGRPR